MKASGHVCFAFWLFLLWFVLVVGGWWSLFWFWFWYYSIPKTEMRNMFFLRYPDFFFSFDTEDYLLPTYDVHDQHFDGPFQENISSGKALTIRLRSLNFSL